MPYNTQGVKSGSQWSEYELPAVELEAVPDVLELDIERRVTRRLPHRSER
nr:hypothetical protein [Methylocucumis oryzae]